MEDRKNAIYRWTLVTTSHKQLTLIQEVLYGFLMAVFFFFSLYLLEQLSSFFSVSLSYVLMLLPLFFVFHKVWRWLIYKEKIEKVAPILWQVVNASSLYLMTSEASLASQGFEAISKEAYQWGLFVVDNLISVFFFDLPEIYEVNFSTITPKSALARFVNAVFRFSLAAGFIDLIYHAISEEGSHYRYGTKKEIIKELQFFPEEQQVKLVARLEPLFTKPQTSAELLETIDPPMSTSSTDEL